MYIQGPPATGTAGVVLSPAVTVAVEDKFGNLVSSDNSSSINLSLSAGTFSNGSKTVTAQVAGGLATFSGSGRDLIVNKAGSYKLTASDGTLTTAGSSAFVISAAPASQTVFQAIPTAGVTAGTVLSPAIKVAVEDSFGNVVTGNSSIVNLALATGPGPFDPASQLSVAAINGVATFSNVIFDKAGKYTLTAVDGSLAIPTSANIPIIPAAATQLAMSQFPTVGTAGTALSPSTKVTLLDQFGNTVMTTTSVTLSLSSGTFSNGSATMTANAINGTAVFSSVIINTAGSYTITASSGTLTGTSFGVTINPAAANKVVYMQAPPPVWTTGLAFSPAVIVGVQDKYGNLVTTDNSSSVTLTLNTGTFSTGSKTATVTASGGTATFSNLIINAIGTYTLTATDGALTSAVSGSIAISLPAGSPSLFLLEKVGDGGHDLAANVADGQIDPEINPQSLRFRIALR